MALKLEKLTIFFSLFFLLFLVSSCEQDINWPWSDKTESAADTTGTEEAESDTTAMEREPDTTTTAATDTAAGESEQDTSMEEQSTVSQASTSETKQWRLVISSMPTEDLAEKYKQRVNEPQADIIYIDRLNTYRVVYASYDDLREAQNEYDQLSNRFPEAWLVYF